MCVCVCVLIAQSFPTLCEPCSLLDSFIDGISRQEYWSRLPFPSSGDLPDFLTQGLNPGFLNYRQTLDNLSHQERVYIYTPYTHVIYHTSKVILKILQAKLQQYMNRKLPDVQAGFRKGRGTRDQIANIHWIMVKAREFQKTSISALLTMPKPLTVWITINCGKF